MHHPPAQNKGKKAKHCIVKEIMDDQKKPRHKSVSRMKYEAVVATG